MEPKDLVAFSISGTALLVSILSVYLNRRQWRIINRPFVVVRLINPKTGNRGTCYELQVLNIGSRPAVGIRLGTDEEVLRRALDPSASFPPDDINTCFKDSTVIGLLIPGESVVSSFGYNGSGTGEQSWMMGSVLPIRISYRDLHGSEFVTKGSITVSTKNGFSGYTWTDK
ncbi:MAG: hypothetical protein IPP19_06145 [Verrucomicrobia bacterium]|nr:hypothetical protein [Verrucomicrobiota bacterium]